MDTTTLVHVGAEDALTAMWQTVAEYGREHVYEGSLIGCQYVHDDAPACLIGHAMHRLGVPIAELDRWDHAGSNGCPVQIGNVDSPLLDMDHTAACVFTAAQRLQDASLPWGHALSQAVRTARANQVAIPAEVAAYVQPWAGDL